jgi:hypothetical protein
MCWAAIIFTRYFPVSFFSCSGIHSVNQALISSIGDLSSNCAMLCYMLDAQLFLQPELILHSEYSLFYLNNGNSDLTTGNHYTQGVNQSHQERCK